MDNIGLKFLLGISNEEQLHQFLYGCIDSLLNKYELLPNNIKSDLEWSQEDCAAAQKFIQNIFRNLVSKLDYNLENEFKDLNTKTIECIKKCYQTRETEIQQAIVNECLTKTNIPFVTDFDWKIKWIIGSSTSASIRESLIQIDLYAKKAGPDEVNTIRMEMNSSQLSQFINQIENCLTKTK